MSKFTRKLSDKTLSTDTNNEDKKLDNADSSVSQSMTEDELSIIYTPETRSKAIALLWYFSILMILIPFSSMYFCYKYIFNGFDEATNILYSGIVAIVTVYIIVSFFVYIAYNDEKDIAKRFKEKRG